LNLLDNTIIVFSSDNGVHNVGGHDPEFFDSNSRFRGCKRDLYEGGIRTPFIVNWPKVVKPGTKTNHISAFWDFLPTVCDIAGITTPSNSDGISFLQTLKGKVKKQKSHEYIYYEFFEMGGKQSILKDGWKLVRLNLNNPAKQTEELYHLDIDISESTNLISTNPQKADELRNLAANARSESSHFKWGQAK
jgi:arylsulfatase A-like enzyme